jgi:molybdopterin molybdotransferase
MTGRAPLAAIAAWIDSTVTPLAAEKIAAAAAADRVLAEPLRAARDVPPRDRASRDGLAVRAEDVLGAGPYNPLAPRTGRAVAAGETLPEGTDTVVPPWGLHGERGEVIASVAVGEGVTRRGEEARAGDLLLPAGHRVAPSDLDALLASGVAEVRVVRKPRIAVIAATARPGEDTVGPLVRALARRDGAEAGPVAPAAGDWDAVDRAFRADGHDAILVIGGTGEGPGDRARAALAGAGEVAVPGVALVPGETAALGCVGERPVVLLPGAPAACRWAYELVAGAVVRRLGGRPTSLPHARRAAVARRKVVSTIGYAEVVPVRLGEDGSASPLPSARRLAWADRADGFVVVPEPSEGIPQGGALVVYLTP